MTELLAAAAEGEPSVLAVPLGDLIIGTIAFLIILVVLGKLLLPKITKTLAEREDAIAGGIKRAEEAQAQSQRMLEEYKALLATARDESAAIRAEAQAERAGIIEEARNEARQVASGVMAAAASQIEAEKKKAISELHNSVGVLATDLAGRIIGESLADDLRASAVVDRFIAEVEQAAPAAPARASGPA